MSKPREVVLGTGALAVGTLVSLACVAVVPAIFLAFCLGAPLAIGRLAVWKLVRISDGDGRPAPVLPTPDGRIVP